MTAAAKWPLKKFNRPSCTIISTFCQYVNRKPFFFSQIIILLFRTGIPKGESALWQRSRGQHPLALIFVRLLVENVPPEHFQGILLRAVSREGGLVRPPSKSCRFSHPPLRVPEYGTGCFVACGRRQGLLALDLGSIFEKLLHQKTF
jgi:hypothetical protein